MTDWNPYAYQFCRHCQYYRPSAEYIYELERDTKLRKCRYTPQCRRAAKISADGQQMKMEEFWGKQLSWWFISIFE